MLAFSSTPLWLIIIGSISLIGFITVITIILIQQHAYKRTQVLWIEKIDLLNGKHDQQYQHLLQTLATLNGLIQAQSTNHERLNTLLMQSQTQFERYQTESHKTIAQSLAQASQSLHQQLMTHLNQHSTAINKQFSQLSETTATQLNAIQNNVETRLNKGFERTTETFQNILRRLTIIDQAQEKITELSSNVVSLQAILADKKSRGAFGEVQLNALIRNMIPENHYALQHTLSNGKKPDCILFLPQPTGNICIDAKFPLENFKSIESNDTSKKQFARDIKTHINAIADKYIIEHETADGAMMFIPAEAIFAEIHANYQELVDYAHSKRVWLVSPTTMMAVLTTARAVLKDDATRKQVHIIQEHLSALGKDFARFQTRMDKLAMHIRQTHQDVDDIHTSSKKISARFTKIEKADLSREQIAEHVVELTTQEMETDTILE
jgi:DNA recombination protein RmuC